MDIPAEAILDDLLDQIKKLTLDNSMLRVALLAYQNSPQIEETDRELL